MLSGSTSYTYRLGVDIGGTFTDIMLMDNRTGKLIIQKVPTTAEDPSVAVVDGLSDILKENAIFPQGIANAIHGTTLVTNAIIERRGAKTGLITTEGFRDALEIGRERRYDIYDLFLELPEPLIPRYLRCEIDERLDSEGNVMKEPDGDEVSEKIKYLLSQDVEAIAVCLLHSYRNPAHEVAVRDAIAKIAPAMSVSLSSDVVPEIREYERTSTTVANVYAKPLCERYLGSLQSELKDFGVQSDLYIMLSNGGIATCDTAGEFPVRIIESGPAAGALAAVFYGKLTDTPDIISFDMGGTTAKTCIITDNLPTYTTDFEIARVHRFKKGSGLPIKVPVIEMIEIGAGGGSIATIDKMGLLKVGPQSAGSDPGPVCCDKGGDDPTVTDADLILGYLNPDYFLGGRMKLNVQKAVDAIRTKIAEPLGLGLARAAFGIHQVVNENMANGSRIHAVEKGKDSRRYALAAFGGAGPVHASRIAEKLRIEKIIVPLAAGATSAFGLLTAPISFDLVRTYISSLGELDIDRLNSIFGDMERSVLSLLENARVPEQDVIIIRSADMRYKGQGFEINVLVPSGEITSEAIQTLQRAFEEEYLRHYKRLNRGFEIEALNWRVFASGPKPEVKLNFHTPLEGNLDDALKSRRKVYFDEYKEYIDCPVYDRYALPPGSSFKGPAIVEERESTAVVSPQWQAHTDRYNNLIMTRCDPRLNLSGSKKDVARTQFGRQAERYANSSVHASGETLSAIVQLAGPTRKDCCLDVATGTGFTAFAVAEFAGSVIATDITPPMLKQARKIAKERGISNVIFQFTDAENLPFKDQTFDIVTCRSAPHHFGDVPAFLMESARVLRRGGRLVVSDPSSPEDDEIDRWINRLNRSAIPRM